ncbi:MAG TPA: cardiolipin synthase [Phycisphaerales bacterium]|nr:cardiolipin synthase [Phycisphaerales bacterium]
MADVLWMHISAVLALGPPGGDWISWVGLYVAATWTLQIWMIITVLRNRRHNVALAWLAVILFHPLIGAVTYLILGRVRIDPVHAGRYERLRAERAATAVCKVEVPVSPRLQDMVRLSSSLGMLPPTVGNSVTLADEHEAFVAGLIRDIDAASQRVWLLYFILWDDATGNRIAQALMRAAARGVSCKVLADAAGSRSFLRTGAPRLRAAGVEVRAALPVNLLRMLVVRADLRNHRKLAIIDDTVAWTGSHNACDADYGGSPHGPWLDITARISGPAVGQYAGIFAEDWYAETGQDLTPATPAIAPLDGRAQGGDGSASVQIVRSGPAGLTDKLEPFFVGAMQEAEKRIVITAPYLVPTHALVLELRVAVLRGVRVDLIVPERGNHPVVEAAGRACYDELLEAGVFVHLHGPGLLHSKTMLVDDSFAMIGTANFDIRSLALNFELNTLIFDPATVERLAAIHDGYLHRARHLTAEDWKRRGSLTRLAENVARLFSPLL